MTARTRLLPWLFVCAVVALPGTSLQLRYHCRVTGARDLAACCCAGENDCAEQAAASDPEDCCAPAEKEALDDCGCCDITLERVGSDLASAPPLPRTDGPDFQTALPLPVHEALHAQAACHHGWAREKVPRKWTGPPVYLLHEALLI